MKSKRRIEEDIWTIIIFLKFSVYTYQIRKYNS